METIPEQTTGSLANPGSGLLAPPVHTMSRSKTGRKPQRSSPLAGPAVLVNDGEDSPSLLRVSSSPILNHDRNFVSPRIPRQNVCSSSPRPKSMMSDFSLSLHKQSLTPRNRSYASGTKQLIRPISSILPLSATQEHFCNPNSSCSQPAGEFQNLGEQYQNSICRHTFPVTRNSKHDSPSTNHLRPPSITLNEQSIDVPQIPPPARSSSRLTGIIPRDNSWYITTAYEATPRFSRLGLAADDVVLPISAKEFKKCQRQRERHSGYSSAKCSSGKKQSLLMGCTLASTLKLSRSNTRAQSDHQLDQEPTSPSPSPSTLMRPSLSSQPSNSFPDSDSSPATSAASSLSPASSLSRKRTSSFTDSSSSTYTWFMPDTVTSSSRTSINEAATQESSPATAHGQKKLSISRSKVLLSSRTKRRRAASGTILLDLEKMSINGGVNNPVVAKDEKLHQGGTFRRFMRLFVFS